MSILVTGGSGFIGANLVGHLMASGDEPVINVDKLTYAAVPGSIPQEIASHPRYAHFRADIADGARMAALLDVHRPRAIFHLAAESHVDRSIDAPDDFVQTNIVGTQRLLDAALAYWRTLPQVEQDRFRFIHVSTDEVFGTLGPTGRFTEVSPYRPRSPYAASKAAADHLARAWHATYGLPVIVTNCSNNYGPRQHPEKLIPLMILNAVAGRPLPVFGRGENVRDWLYVADHARGLDLVARTGVPGATYCFGGGAESSNLSLVERICDLLDARLGPLPDGTSRRSLIAFVEDRPGHDFRYAIDAAEVGRSLGWRPQVTLDKGLEQTIDWYLSNRSWWRPVVDGGGTARRGLDRVQAAAG